MENKKEIVKDMHRDPHYREFVISALTNIKVEKISPSVTEIVEINNKFHNPQMRRTCRACGEKYNMPPIASSMTRPLSVGPTSCPLCTEQPVLYRFINLSTN